MKTVMTALLALLAFVSCAKSEAVFSLTGEWQLQNAVRGIVINGTVPGSMYTALLNSHHIQNPYYRNNDVQYKWIANDNWTYSRSFTINENLLQKRTVLLVCEGLDTISSIYVNDVMVGTSKNMFLRYVFDIKKALKTGENKIRVEFESAVAYAERSAQNLSYPILPECPPQAFHGECHVNMIRKEQCSFSWDWGPSFPTQGIWRNIYIEAFDGATIRDVTADTTKNSNGEWVLTVETFLVTSNNVTSLSGQLEIRVNDLGITEKSDVTITPKNSSVTKSITIPKDVPVEQWMPNGHGNQTLYKMYVSFETPHTYDEMSARKFNVGFRTVELVQDLATSDPSKGMLFYFRVNGKPIFLKGSNWIPADSFPERSTPEIVRELLEYTAEANMNVLRVWGGGYYESNDFYEICDQLGILIWQDFMFSVSLYPADDQFLDLVRQEVTYQIRRLKKHPSILILAGNNENEKAVVQGWFHSEDHDAQYRSDYLKLYKDTIKPIANKEWASIPFQLSSPSDGKKTEEEGGIANDPSDTHYGDTHTYIYNDPVFEPQSYVIARFVSEYGLQSYPSFETMETVYDDEDLRYGSDLNEHRQHHPFGDVQILTEMTQMFNMPNNPDRKQRFKDIIFLNQMSQALGIQVASEHFRRWQNQVTPDGRGNTMGAMYWMLYDIWQAPTWASIEHGTMKWKPLHYYAKRFFSPVLLSPFENQGQLEVYLILDHLPVIEHRHRGDGHMQFHIPFSERQGYFESVSVDHSSSGTLRRSISSVVTGTLIIEMYSWDRMQPLYTWNINYTVSKTSESIFSGNISAMMSEARCIRRANCLLYFHFGNRHEGTDAWFPLSTHSNVYNLQKALVQVTNVVALADKTTYNVTISTNNIAPFVWLDAYHIKGHFSENGFLLVSPVRTIQFYSRNTINIQTLRAALSITTLTDIAADKPFSYPR